MVPCAQGRVIVETARPAPPHFATCSTYRRPVSTNGRRLAEDQSCSRGAVPKDATLDAPATRPEDLRVTRWYLDAESPPNASPGACDRSSYPSHSYNERETAAKLDLPSTKDSSSVEDETSRVFQTFDAPRKKKACMDLRDAIALLDETCPNQEPSPSFTPRTPRTPLTPYPRNKRARSKSSDNSSNNYSNDRLSERSVDVVSRSQEKRKPFLRKIGISKTEDRPFLAKLTPRITGKPYLEKIGPSKAMEERPYLLDKVVDSSWKIGDEPESVDTATQGPAYNEDTSSIREKRKTFASEERARSGKRYLLKMYSFETEDVVEDSKGGRSPSVRGRRDPLRGASLDDVLDRGPSSLPPMESFEGQTSLELEPKSRSVAELVKCRITSSEEIVVSPSWRVGSPGGLEDDAIGWGSSSSSRRIRRQRDRLFSARVADDAGPTTTIASPTFTLSPESRAKGSVLVSKREETSFSGTASSQTFEEQQQDALCRKRQSALLESARRKQLSSRGDDPMTKKKGSSTEAFVAYTCRPSESSFDDQSRRALERKENERDASLETFKRLHDRFELQNLFSCSRTMTTTTTTRSGRAARTLSPQRWARRALT